MGKCSKRHCDGDSLFPHAVSREALVFSFCHRDLKVSNLLMTDKGCVKTGGCRCWLFGGGLHERHLDGAAGRSR